MGGRGSKYEFRQLFDRESCTYTYLIGSRRTGGAVLIDPVLELVERDSQLVKDLGLRLEYCLNTHVHADHITGSGLLKQRWESCKSVLGSTGNEAALADVKLQDGEVLQVGDIAIKAISTPGHTNGCHCFLFDMDGKPMIFTGDTLLIRGCGRTDFQQGDSSKLFDSIRNKIFSLPDETVVLPAHDYKGQTCSTVLEEKLFNPRVQLTKTREEFIQIMQNLKLDYPKKIDIAVPANLVCGLHDVAKQ